MIRIHIEKLTPEQGPAYLVGLVEINGVFVIDDREFIRNNEGGARRTLKRRLEAEVKSNRIKNKKAMVNA